MKTMHNAQCAMRNAGRAARAALRAAAGALWLLWVLPGILVAACSASAEEEADARLKAIDGGAAR